MKYSSVGDGGEIHGTVLVLAKRSAKSEPARRFLRRREPGKPKANYRIQ